MNKLVTILIIFGLIGFSPVTLSSSNSAPPSAGMQKPKPPPKPKPIKKPPKPKPVKKPPKPKPVKKPKGPPRPPTPW